MQLELPDLARPGVSCRAASAARTDNKAELMPLGSKSVCEHLETSGVGWLYVSREALI